MELNSSTPDFVIADDSAIPASGSTLSFSSGKDNLLPRGFAGSIYQVKLLMLLAFDAFSNKKRFHLYTEAEGFGKFDDGVLFLEDGMKVMQAKHNFDGKGRYLLKDLTGETKEKKAALSKYFDSWLMIETLRRKDPKRYPEPVEYLFYTNHELSIDDGLTALYNEKTGRFSEKIFGQPLEAGTQQEEARKAIMGSIYKHIEDLDQKIKQACKGLVDLLCASPKETGKAKGAVVVRAKNNRDIQRLFALLLQSESIEKKIDRGMFDKGHFYQLTNKFVSGEELPPVLKKLRELLFKEEKFETDTQRRELCFVTVESSFADLDKTKISSAFDAALAIGYLGQEKDDFLNCDVGDVDQLVNNMAPQGVCNFFRQFQFKVKQPNEAEMTKVLEKKIGKYFNIADRGAYHYFYEKMLDFLLAESDKSITKEDVDNLFKEARRAFDRNGLVGHSFRYEQHIKRLHGVVLIFGTSNFVSDFIQSNRSLMICHGNNNWSIAMTICSELQRLKEDKKLKEDGYGFIDAGYAVLDKDPEIFSEKSFRLLIVDRAESLNETQLSTLIQQSRLNDKKLVLLTTNKDKLKQQIRAAADTEIDDNDCNEIPLLSEDAVTQNIATQINAGKGIIIGERYISFENMKSNAEYFKVMRNAYLLATMLQQAVSKPEKQQPKERLFIRPSLTYKIPVYKAESILDIRFDVIHFDKVDLSSIPQILCLDFKALIDIEETNSLEELIEENKDPDMPRPQGLYIKGVESGHTLSRRLKDELKKYGKLFFVGEAAPAELGKVLNLHHQTLDGKERYILANSDMFQYMPQTTEYKILPEEPYDERLVQKAEYPYRRVLLSDYGSGKTYLTEELLRDTRSNFGWIICIPAKTLSETMCEWSLTQLAEHYLDISPLEAWQRQILQCDIKTGNVLWIIDGFDEMITAQREQLKEQIGQLVQQPHCLITSRPSVAPFIPLQPNQFIALQAFDEAQIDQFVDGYFNHSEQCKTAKRLIKLWKAKNQLSLLGKPLMCRIACEIIQVGFDTEELSDITLASLFDYFIQVNFRKYQCNQNYVPESRLTGKRLYHLSHVMVERLKEVSYAILFPESVDTRMEPDRMLDEDLLQLGLVKEIKTIPATKAADYLFDHQTQIEYFAALFWVKKLLLIPAAERREHLQTHWAGRIYDIELRVVWQFVAGIVSTNHNVFLIGKGSNAFDAFCSFLLDSAEDLVGKVRQELLHGCYHNMQESALKGSEYKSKFENNGVITGKDDSVGTVQGKQLEEFRTSSHMRRTSSQIIADYAYRDAYVIASQSIPLPEDISKYIRNLLSSSNYYVLNKLSVLKQYLEQEKVCSCLANEIRNRMLEIYSQYKDNAEEYRQAYALLAFMIDDGLIKLEDCVEDFTCNFDQKNCVLDVVRRLDEASLLTDEHLNVLFKTGRPRFWDYDAGLPAILLLRDRLNDAMVEMLRANIVDRDSGDWEIDRAIQILTQISQEGYNIEQTKSLLNLFIEICSADECHISTEKRRALEHTLFTSQDVNWVGEFFSSYFTIHQLSTRERFYEGLRLLNYFCNFYDLAVIIENGVLKIMGRINFSITLPETPVIQELVCETLRKFRDKGTGLNVIRKQFRVYEIYSNLLKVKGSWIAMVCKENNSCLLYHVAEFLPQSTQIENDLKEELNQLREQLPDKSTFVAKVTVLHAFNKPLGFVDNYLLQKAQCDCKEDLDFWDCDGGIAATGWLGNDFGKGAYEYLKCCYNSWRYAGSYVEGALQKVTTDVLNDSKAIYFILKTILVIKITEQDALNELGKALVENLGSADSRLLVEGFKQLSKDTTLTSSEKKKLRLLSEKWSADINRKPEEKIVQVRVADNPASLFPGNKRIRHDDRIAPEDGKKPRYSI